MSDFVDDDIIGQITSAAYEDAFRQIALSENDIEMLRTHYAAPDRTITATQMASALGFNVFSAANLHYGKFAHRVSEQLRVSTETSLYILVTFDRPDREWEWTMRSTVAEAIERLGIVSGLRCALPEELSGKLSLFEGASYRISINAYERNPTARRKCIEHYGACCVVCGFCFGTTFGSVGEGFIHVHHLCPIGEIGQEYVIDPIADLRPVCPNCHAALHLRNPPYSIDEVREFLASAQ